MNDDLPTPTARRGVWRVLGWAVLVAVVAACGWREYDYRAAVREARAAGFRFEEGPTPFAAIRADWQAALRLATWTERERGVALPDGADLAPLRPLLLRLDPTHLMAVRCRQMDALRGLTRLQYLDLDGCTDVADLAPLAGLAQLQALYLSRTGVVDLAPLAGLARLQELDLNSCTGLGVEAVVAFKKGHPQVAVIGPDGREVQAQ